MVVGDCRGNSGFDSGNYSRLGWILGNRWERGFRVCQLMSPSQQSDGGAGIARVVSKCCHALARWTGEEFNII